MNTESIKSIIKDKSHCGNFEQLVTQCIVHEVISDNFFCAGCPYCARGILDPNDDTGKNCSIILGLE